MMHGRGHSAKHSQSHSWGAWSEWIWDPISSKYYAERFDSNRNVEYVWEDSAPTANDHQRTPRTEASIDQLTTGLGSLGVGSPGYNHVPIREYQDPGSSPSYDHAQANEYQGHGGSRATNSTPDVTKSPQYTIGTSYHDPQGYLQLKADKGKGIADANSYDNRHGEGHSVFGSIPSTANSFGQYNYLENRTPRSKDHEKSIPAASSGGNPGYTTDPGYTTSNDLDSTDYQVEQVLKESRNELLWDTRAGESSASGAIYNPGFISPGTYDLDHVGPHGDELDPQATSIPLRPSFPTMSASNFVNTPIITGTPGSVEQIDNRFVVEHSNKFQPGEVFKILWSEPTGQAFNDDPISDVRTINDSTSPFYVGYRRFIIVTTDDSHHSTCIPILTYDRRGCCKNGVRPSKHGIVYATGQKPRLLPKEPALGFDPVPLDIYAEGESLARESRVNYSKLVTIEHNVKVFFIGRITPSYFQNVSNAVDKCWHDKRHTSSNRRSRR